MRGNFERVMQARSYRRMGVAEYVAFDRSQDARWEYVNGEAFAMAGGRPEHRVVVDNLVAALKTTLKGKPCMPIGDGQKVSTRRTGAYHYPDATVVCGPVVRDPDDDHAFTNPTVLFEVLSPSTADYDRGGKFVHYRTLETLREYVVVDEEARTVEHHARSGPDRWVMTIVRTGTLELAAAGVALALDDLWADVERVRA